MNAGIPETTDTIYGVPVPSLFNFMITNTQALYKTWRDSIDIKAAEESRKEGKTISVDDSISAMKSFISRKAGVIADKYPKGSPNYEEFFPRGVSEYTNASKKNADMLFKRFNTAFDNHKADFDESILVEASEKYNTFVELRKNQLQSVGKVKDGMTDSDLKRFKVGVQLYKNLLTLCLINAEQPEKAANYFDEAILKKKSNGKEPLEPPKA